MHPRFLSSISDIPSEEWNALCATAYPFLRHEFLAALEQSGSCNAQRGWQPMHLALYDGEKPTAAVPLYIKAHSYGEYVFDWGVADAYRRLGRSYYPKMLTAIPFTPASGPRICGARNLKLPLDMLVNIGMQRARQDGFSSWHWLFVEEELSRQLAEHGLCRRVACQFHWFNEGYADFADFLDGFSARKRKSLLRERRKVAEQGVELETLSGDAITADIWHFFYRCYQETYVRRSGHGGYLEPDFFVLLNAALPDSLLLIVARQHGEPIAAALCVLGADVMYGRYWGALRDIDCLHFEACYYQGIEYCIAKGLARFDPGVQGEHKIQRGFRPILSWSNHWFADADIRDAFNEFTQHEEAAVLDYRQAAESLLPFKRPA